MPRHQVVRVCPTRLASDSLEPVADRRIHVPVDADLIVEEQVSAQRKIGDRDAIANDVAPSVEMRAEDAPRTW